MKQEYINIAFISYKREDEKWAKWLQKKLESYRIPTTIRNENTSLPKYIRPIFRDKTDLSGGSLLHEELEKELLASKYLIIVCSPNATKSDWVNKEAATFIREGRVGNIIPFIVDGEPHSIENTNECFPKALLDLPSEQELLGINVKEVGKPMAFIRLVSRIIDVKFDSLWQRHKRQQRLNRTIIGSLLFFTLIGALFAYDYTRTKTEYYSDWVDCYGIAEGIRILDYNEVSHRTASYKFEYKRVPLGEQGFYSWRLFRVSLVNSKGKLEKEGQSDRYAKCEYYYTDSHLAEIVNYNEFNSPVVTYRVHDDYEGNTACIYDLESTNKQLGEVYINASTTSLSESYFSPNQNKSKIKRFHYTRDENGHIVRVTYHAFDGEDLQQSAVSDNNGIFGEKYKLDSIGRRVCYEYIGYDGQPTMNKYGVSMYNVRYNRLGDIEETSYYNIDKELVVNESGYAIGKVEFDEYERPVSVRYLDVNLKPCYNTDLVAGYNVQWDENGFKIRQESIGINNNRCYNKENIAYAEMSYDGKGNCIEIVYYDISGNKNLSSEWINGCKVKYDNNNRIISVKSFDVAGKESVNKTFLVSERRYKYDSYGNIIEDAFYSNNKRAFSSSQGYSYIVNMYNKYNQLESQTLYDENDKKIYSNEMGYSVVKYKYDGRGNVVQSSYYDEKNGPMVTRLGYSSMIDKYDNYGNVVEEKYLGVNNEPVFRTEGYSKLTIRYNNKGEAMEYRYYGTNDSLCLDNNWVSILKREYDNYGRMVQETYFNTDSIPCISKSVLAAGIQREYDTKGNVLREAFVDKKGHLTLCNSNYAYIMCKYDNRNNRIEIANYDVDQKPCVFENRYHIIKTEYNEKGQKILEQYFDTNGKPVKNEGVYQLKYDYSDTHLIIKTSNLDPSGNLMNVKGWAYCIYEYDAYGRNTSLKYFNSSNKLSWKDYDYTCHREFEYDKYGNIILEQSFDPNGKLTTRGGWAKKESTYDDHSRPTYVRYTDAKGKLLGGAFNAAIEKYTYNGEKSKLSLYGIDSTFIINVNIVEKVGRIVETSYTDSYGKLTLFSVQKIGTTKFATRKNEYDDRGLMIKQSFFDVDGNLYSKDSIAAYYTFEYDEKGRFIKQMCFDSKGRLMEIAPQGVAIMIQSYDKYGNLAEQSYYDKNNKLAKTPWGWSRRLQVFDEYGKTIKDTYYRLDGNIESHTSEERATEESSIPEEERRILIMQIETSGQMYDKGYRGTYGILVYNEWNTTQSMEAFVDALMNSKGKKKHLVLVQFLPEDFGEVIEETFSEDNLNARIMDNITPTTELRQDIIKKYKEWLASKKK